MVAETLQMYTMNMCAQDFKNISPPLFLLLNKTKCVIELSPLRSILYLHQYCKYFHTTCLRNLYFNSDVFVNHSLFESNQNKLPSPASSLTYHQVCNKSNTSGAPEFIPGF